MPRPRACSVGPGSDTKPDNENKQKAKAAIPKALREQVWITYAGRVFERKCWIPWCTNTISVFDFHVGHDKPESHGGATEIHNLRPICARCNLSMGSQYSITQWTQLSGPGPVSISAPAVNTSCWGWLFRRVKR